jgi:hypothetical protein
MKIQLRAESVREEDQEVFRTLRQMGVYGQYDPEHSKVGETAFILLSKRCSGKPVELTPDQVKQIKDLSAVTDVR